MIDYKFYIKKIIRKIFNLKELPTEEDIKEAKKILDTLNDPNKDKTLNNIIKFQESKIPYWNERAIITDEPIVNFLIIIMRLSENPLFEGL